MTLTKTPICDFGKKAESFELKSIENKIVSLNDVKGKNGTLIMFICNHCPYVKAVINDIVNDSNILKKEGINFVAIMSNDTKNYPDDSFENMIKFAKEIKALGVFKIKINLHSEVQTEISIKVVAAETIQ